MVPGFESHLSLSTLSTRYHHSTTMSPPFRGSLRLLCSSFFSRFSPSARRDAALYLLRFRSPKVVTHPHIGYHGFGNSSPFLDLTRIFAQPSRSVSRSRVSEPIPREGSLVRRAWLVQHFSAISNKRLGTVSRGISISLRVVSPRQFLIVRN